ncbi:response regulator transcription factor [Vagococcus penaei]|uniref:DNA-binding response regulator n=1 Tax=Vagococcus penaei TaxID=633807 RepID=A0A1Q2D5H6_9ENTE|nr:response regulator [Vagococcus penaei]AQP53648.1 hypothetical protein BW732_04955 [Vagococcus penaei]
MNLITILIVDDEKSIRDGLKLLLPWETHGFRIIGEAENGLDAISKIKENQPDIVITDLIMPELDGLKLSAVIQEQYPAIHFLVLSSYDDFPYVSQSFKNGAVDYILKPTLTPDKLLTTLINISKKMAKKEQTISHEELLSQQLNRFLSGYDIDNQQTIERYFKSNQYFILYTNFLWYKNKEHLLQTCQTLLPNNLSLTSLPFTINNNEYGFIISTNLTQKELLDMVSSNLVSLRLVEKKALFILSSPIDDMRELKKQLNFLISEGYEQRFYFKQHSIITQQEFLSLNDMEQYDTKKYLRSLLNEDYLMSLSRIEKQFDQLIIKLPRPTLLKQQASSIFYTLFSTLIDVYTETTEINKLKQHFLFSIGEIDYLEDFSLFILTTIQQLKDIITRNNTATIYNDELLNNIVTFIGNNYHTNLSLITLAETFHFNYSYLSSFFSNHFHTSFSEYLNTVRLKEAKRLLLESSFNMSEIATACGYSDLSYFSKLFKKCYGASPSKYRRENQL